MKKILFLSLFSFVFLTNCNKDDAENTIDCLFAGVDFNVTHTIDATDPMTVHFTISYDGEYSLDNSKHWDFGDGTSQDLNGNTVSHTYSTSGDFTVKVKPTIRNGDAYCTPELTENVTIN